MDLNSTDRRSFERQLFFRHATLANGVAALSRLTASRDPIARALSLPFVVQYPKAATRPVVDTTADESILIPGCAITLAGHRRRIHEHRNR